LQAYSHLFSSLAATATPEIYTLSLHDALPICTPKLQAKAEYDVETQIYRLSFKQSLKTHAKYLNLKAVPIPVALALFDAETGKQDRKSTRLNSSHVKISYAVFCLKKKKIEVRL